MRRLLFLISGLVLIPTITLALTFEPANYYNDVQSDSPEAAGINMLTRENIVRGYGSRQFGPMRRINRAEFLKIAMLTVGDDAEPLANCFPDVRIGDWFSPYVCAAKSRGIVAGKTVPHRFGGQTYFDPAAPVTYGEALKMLTLLFGYQAPSAPSHWAERYYRAAAARGVDLPITIELDKTLTRGQAVRLAAAFLAESKGQLQELSLAEAGHYPSSSSSSRTSSSSSSSSSRSSSMSSSSSSRMFLPPDPISDTSIRSQFLLLGDVSPVLGSVKLFLNEEPLRIEEVSINLAIAATSVDSILVYDEDKRFLGRATVNNAVSGSNYRLIVPTGALTVPKSDETRLYFRAELKSRDNGGVSGQDVQIADVTVTGDGEWSNRPYTKQSTVTDTFLAFETARAAITNVKNAGPTNAALVPATNQLIGSFTFEGRKTDSSAETKLQTIRFQIEQTGGVSLSNVKIGLPGVPDRHNCTVSGTEVVCSSIPSMFGTVMVGTVTDGPLTINVYGDITATDTQHASLRLTINDPGSTSSSGAVTWTDGTATFTWVGLVQPVVQGTRYSY